MNPVQLHRKGWRKFQRLQEDESNARKESSPRMLQFYQDIVLPRKPIEHMTQRFDHICELKLQSVLVPTI